MLNIHLQQANQFNIWNGVSGSISELGSVGSNPKYNIVGTLGKVPKNVEYKFLIKILHILYVESIKFDTFCMLSR